jgi:hypothetical protein
MTDADHSTHMAKNHFQDGYAAYNYQKTACQTAITALRLRDLNKEWEALDLLADVGVNENSMTQLAKRIRGLNALRPAANQKTHDDRVL